MPNFAKGASAIHETIESRGQSGGNYRPYLPNIFWNNDEFSERYVLILNPLDEIVRVGFHPFIETDNGPRSVIARTDQCVGERTDPIEEKWSYGPRQTNLMIAVLLEPTFKQVNGRDKVDNFAVSLREVERRIRDDDGELTDEKETIDVPEVGLVAQSPFNFGNQLAAYHETEGDISTTPFKVKKVGEGSNTVYQFIPYDSIEVDLTNLFEYLDNVSYVEDAETLLSGIESEGMEAAHEIGQYLLDKKLEELIDIDYYNEILEAISKPSRYPSNAGRETKTTKTTSRPKRPTGKSDAPTARSRKPDEETTQVSAKERLAKLRESKAAKEAATADTE